jgi:hypothetical protein
MNLTSNGIITGVIKTRILPIIVIIFIIIIIITNRILYFICISL